jgi:glycosyltransferase involved in cell wall biosynthesis
VLSVVMPAHNEQDYLVDAVVDVIAGLRARDEPSEVIVCENGSTDRTPEVAGSLEEQYPEIRVLRSPDADYGRALREGFLAARGEVVANFDVDYIDLDFLRAALALLASPGGPAMVVASKRISGAVDTRRRGRRVVTAVFSGLLRIGFGLKVTDTHGMKVMRKSVLAPLVSACRFDADLFDTELILRAERAGLHVAELPVTVRDTRPPRSSIVGRIPRSLAGLVRLKLSLLTTDKGGPGNGDRQRRAG